MEIKNDGGFLKAHVKYRNPNELYDYVLRKTQDEEKHYYVFIDEKFKGVD